MDYISYFNDVMVRFEEALYHEISGEAYLKAELVGTDFIKLKNVTGNTAEELIARCAREIISAGIAKDVTCLISGLDICLKLNVRGCLHLPVEAKLRKDGIVPFMCPIANMFIDQLIDVLGYESGVLAALDIDENKGECVVKCAIYETAEAIGRVSDWTNI